ncbi:MAG: hypothetical protein AB7F22_21460, partial [Reyranella sp.]|uniref:hypothetical protein n=1 Tax=Reyranella sp. TaxID=1929291 RepID=UPI003D0E71C2
AGGGGDDSYHIDNAGDLGIEAGGGGNDTIYASVDYTLAAGQEIESLRVDGENGLHLTANDFGMELVGGEGADTLTGGAGSDVIFGGAGADVMDGGDFSVGDTFHVDNVGDQVVGHVFSSTIYTSVDFTVSGGVDSATVYAVGPTGLHLTGGSGINTLVGADGDDTLTGGAFVNSLDGGAGADIMIGGADADYYYVDNAGDQVIEAESDNIIGKFDTIYASIDYALAAGQEVEYLRVAGVNGLRLTGNDFGMELVGAEGSDTLTGGAGNDTIKGGAQLSGPFDPPPGDTLRGGAGDDHIFGGAGSDIIDGGAGADIMDTGSEYFGSSIDGSIMGIPSSDTIYVDNAGDQVFGSTWTSTIYVSTDWTATGNVSGATVRVVGSAGLHLTAGGIKYALIGGAGDDTLTAVGSTVALDGGAGADIMTGGTGRNTYYVDNIGDQVIDAAQNDGTGFSGDPPRSDIIFTSVDYTVAAGQEIEHMYATGVNGLRLTGNEFAMNLYGNVGDDTLNGGGGVDTLNGGAGNDLLVGGTGNDILVFGLASGHDKVGDFTSGTDKIDLTAYDFASFAEVMTLASDVGANTVITLDASDTVTLSGVHISQLSSGDFLL